MILSDKEFQELLEDLHSSDLSLRIATLESIHQHPSGDIRIVPYLEAMLNDTTLCIIGIPYLFGEIRWLAAHALSAELSVANADQHICLYNIVRPLNTEEFVAIRNASGVEGQGGIEGILETLEVLRDMGCLPLYNLHL